MRFLRGIINQQKQTKSRTEALKAILQRVLANLQFQAGDIKGGRIMCDVYDDGYKFEKMWKVIIFITAYKY